MSKSEHVTHAQDTNCHYRIAKKAKKSFRSIALQRTIRVMINLKKHEKVLASGSFRVELNNRVRDKLERRAVSW